MKPELWLNRADHELSLAQELLDAGSLLWAVSYAHRSVEYALEGLIVMKTGVRPEKGSRMDDLHALSRIYLPDTINTAVADLVQVTPVVWQSDLANEKLINTRAKSLVEGAKKTIKWFGDECGKADSPCVEASSFQS
jgi:HEPN domain-containing protein